MAPKAVLPLLVPVFIAVVGCSSRAEQQKGTGWSARTEVTFGTEDGFEDVTLPAGEPKELPTGGTSIEAKGLVDGKDVGFLIKLGSTWKGSQMAPDVNMQIYAGSIVLESIGAPSDVFVKSLAQEYKTKLRPAKMKEQVKVDGLALEGNPSNLNAGVVKIKIFFNSDSEKEGEYAEAFLNLDMKNKQVQFNEKDEEYREAIMRALSSG
jgi:hypothetical protein